MIKKAPPDTLEGLFLRKYNLLISTSAFQVLFHQLFVIRFQGR